MDGRGWIWEKKEMPSLLQLGEGKFCFRGITPEDGPGTLAFKRRGVYCAEGFLSRAERKPSGDGGR